MYLSSDKQTLNDLAIVENNHNEKILFSLFKHAETDGGNKCIENWLYSPLKNEKLINERLEAVFCTNLPTLTFDRDELDFIEFYMSSNDTPVDSSILSSYAMAAWRLLRRDPQRYIVRRGIDFLIAQIRKLYTYSKEINDEHPIIIKTFSKEIKNIAESSKLKPLIHTIQMPDDPHYIDQIDYILRYEYSNTVRTLLNIVYSIDAIQTLRRTAQKRGYCRPQILRHSPLRLKDFYHPCLKSPVENSWDMEHSTICLFTGSNMAGKSTTLKSISIAVWLAHCGFPVPALAMNCPVFDHIYTSINLSDSLKGRKSHFYTEVLRVKEILNKVSPDESSFILFDELFRGTNAKDAFEASDAVIDILKQRANSIFLISTHIIELAFKYQPDKKCSFYYMHSKIKNDKLNCYYTLKKGISESRVGYWIVKKELMSEDQK
ncbi:DNA mismatch repair protein MutS [Bacteroides sp. 224]|nr:DNA mismatch repair protein MutS [Bacteroides sp. 224]